MSHSFSISAPDGGLARRSGGALLLAVALLLPNAIAFAQNSSTEVGLPPSPAPDEVQLPGSSGHPETPSGPGASPVAKPVANPLVSRATELWQDKPLGQLTASIALNLPKDEELSATETVRLNQAAPLLAGHGQMFSVLGDSRPWMLASYEWEAPATRHLPLFFEEPNLERLGYTFGWRTCWCGEEGSVHVSECLQPFVSAAHFFGRVPLIPYLCGLDEPCEPIYTLGVDRPGSPVPYRRHFLPFSLKGALYQAGATVGLVYIIP